MAEAGHAGDNGLDGGVTKRMIPAIADRRGRHKLCKAGDKIRVCSGL